jgi:hypothetical protein
VEHDQHLGVRGTTSGRPDPRRRRRSRSRWPTGSPMFRRRSMRG